MKLVKHKGDKTKSHFYPLLATLIPSHLPLITLLVLLAFLSISGISQYSGSELNKQLAQVAHQPTLADRHLELGLIYSQTRQVDLARQELAIGQHLLTTHPSTDVLGATSTLSKLHERLEALPEENKKRSESWREITGNYPAYRDGWVQLLYLAYNEGDVGKAREYLEVIKSLDPNFTEDLPEELVRLQ